MAGWRQNKRRMRRDVHRTMEVPAFYLARRDADPIEVSVRLHVTFGVSEISGTGEGLANMLDVTPRIIFKRSEVSVPLRGGIVSVARGEAYSIGATRPPDDEFITADVSRMDPSTIADLPIPEESGC